MESPKMLVSRIRSAAVRLWRSPVSIVVYFAGLVLLAFVLGSSPSSRGGTVRVHELDTGPASSWAAPMPLLDAAESRAAMTDGPVPAVGLYWLKSSDPTGGTGMPAPLDQLLIRTDQPSLYYKSGASNFAWTRIGTGTGGGGGGTVDSIACGTGLGCAPASPITTSGTISLNITPTTCPLNQAEIATAFDGTSICAAFLPGSAVSGTTNRLSKFTSASAIGNSTVSDDGTTFAVNTTALTVTEASGNSAIAGTLQLGGALNLTTHLIDNVADPVGLQDAATKNYVDNSAAGAVTGTVNFVAKFSGAHAVGNSLLFDDGTTFSVNSTMFTVTEANGNAVIAGTLSVGGALNMNSHLIDNVTNPVSAQDAATKNYVDTAVNGTANTVPKFTALHVIGNSSITDDGVTFAVNSTALSIVEASGNATIGGTCSIGGALNMNSHLINNVTNPVSAQDAATKNYVDGSTTGAVSGTTNQMAKFTATNVVGNSSVSDNGTTFNINSGKFTVTEASGNTVVGGTCSIGGALDMTTHLIDNVVDPVSAQDAATKNYVDTAVNGTSNTVPKFTATHTLGNSSITDNATTFAINSTQFTVTEASGNVAYLGTLAGGSTGQFTVSALGLVQAPKVLAQGSTAGNTALVGNFTQTAQTAAVGAVAGNNTGTYNATAAVRTSFGAQFSDTATRSAGANNLTNIGMDTSASGAQVNWAARFNGGDVNLAANHFIATGTAPSLTSCGTGASITGSDYAATFSTGTGGTSCTYTFATTYGAAPTCVISAEGGAAQPSYTTSATAITFATTIASTTYDVMCVGHQ